MNSQSFRLAIIASIATSSLLATNHAHATVASGPPPAEYIYQFTSDTSGDGFGAELYFLEPQNASGSVSDIDLNNSYIDTPNGNFSLAGGIEVPFLIDVGPISQNGTLSWNSSGITSMDLSGETTALFFGVYPDGGLDWEITPTNISETPFSDEPSIIEADPSANGSWTYVGSTVPDGFNTGLIFAGVASILAVAGIREKRLCRA